MNPDNQLEAFTVTFLTHQGQYLLLQRSPTKSFAPNRWTGLGGHVEPDEFSHLREAALREVQEEAGFSPHEIAHFVHRRALFALRPGHSLRVVLYSTGELLRFSLPDCPEGTLRWIRPPEFASLDLIETTRVVLDCLIADMQRDPAGTEPLKTGLAAFAPDGRFQHITWS